MEINSCWVGMLAVDSTKTKLKIIAEDRVMCLFKLQAGAFR